MAQKEVLMRLRQHAMEIFDAALDAGDPVKAVKGAVRREGDELVVSDLRIDLKKVQRVLVVGAGKATAAMAGAVEELLGDRLDLGLISVKYGHAVPLARVKVKEAGHPIPDRNGEDAARQIMELLLDAVAKDLVISCISGGGSALLPLAADPVTLNEKVELTRLLLGAGADIHEMNAVRKHLSVTKGGNLMRIAYPARVLSLILSDVVGDEPDTIASGPFAADRSTFEEALGVLEKYGLLTKAPRSIVQRLEDGAAGLVPETPKPGDEIFSRAWSVIVGSNAVSLAAAAIAAQKLGYRTMILSSRIVGDTTQAALFHAAIAEEVRATGHPIIPPACILSGGETTVTLRGNGLGGRNQEFALSLVEIAARLHNVVILSAGSDGTDGPTDAAGALVDTTTCERAVSLGLDPSLYLRNNDSYHFFEPLGDLIKTGPTLTNVMDVRIMLFA
ncbi:MAG: glycerate kinase [Desulfomonile sp.]|nr:glycerate kinase [Desulfomonile sp.]